MLTKNNIIIILIILSLNFILSCTCQKSNFNGAFFKSKDNTQEIIFQDTTFEYAYKLGMYHYNCSKGKYKKINNTIIINSNISDFFNLPLKINESKTFNTNGLIFNIIFDTLNTCSITQSYNYKCRIIFNDNDTSDYFTNILMIKKNAKYFRIYINFFEIFPVAPIPFNKYFVSENYYIKDISSNKFDIYLPISNNAVYYLPIINNILHIKRNRLVWKRKIIFLYSSINKIVEYDKKEVFYRKLIKDANLLGPNRTCKCDFFIN